MSKIIVLTDGECRFCDATNGMGCKKLDVMPSPTKTADLSQYGLTYEQCSKAVHVVHGGKTYVGAAAIAYLLSRRGNWILGFIVRASGPLGRFGYKWVAGHRNSLLIRTATKTDRTLAVNNCLCSKSLEIAKAPQKLIYGALPSNKSYSA
jgi:predicted DCC family thiol-disulfide oxidoreductase YuxK